ncbi:MAG: hypothetical protein JW718_05200 [Desulfovibrionaceae bacterium]|nr:hypothetical protein [Desulfovibrionaceae bacterium]
MSIIPLVFSAVSSAAGLAGSLDRDEGSAAEDLAARRAEEEAEARRKQAEERVEKREKVARARELEEKRLKDLKGQRSTLVTGGAGLLNEAEVKRAGLKKRLGE